MIVVPEHRADLVQPGAVAFDVAAQRLLDRRVGQHALDLRVLRRHLVERDVFRRPDVGPHVDPVVGDHVGRHHLLALLPGQLAVRHRREPDVGVEPDLMAPVAGHHRSAARLRHVADQQARPADRRHLGGEPFEERDQVRMAPVAVARQPHHLPGRPVDRQRHAAGETAVGVVADRARRHRGRRGLAAEQFLGRRVGIVRVGQRGQRLGIERAEVLRGGGAADHEQQQAKRTIESGCESSRPFLAKHAPSGKLPEVQRQGTDSPDFTKAQHPGMFMADAAHTLRPGGIHASLYSCARLRWAHGGRAGRRPRAG